MKSRVTFNHITLITDGCSNCGTSPVEAAKIASKNGVTVNVIGIVDGSSMDNYGEYEIERIAEAGGGLSRVVKVSNISKTIQIVTRQAMTNTIQQVVNSQLSSMFANKEEEIIPITDRVKTVHMVDNIAEYSNLKVLLLIDQSSSMINKMKKVEEAVLDFFLSLQSRAGDSKIAVATFPNKKDIIDIKIPWTEELNSVNNLISKLSPNGKTPTGSAIMSGISYFNYVADSYMGKGVLDEYII